MYGSDDTQVSPAHKPSSRPTVQSPGQPGSTSSSLLLSADHGREAEGSCGWRVCWKKLPFAQNQEEKAGKTGWAELCGAFSPGAYTQESSLLVLSKSIH